MNDQTLIFIWPDGYWMYAEDYNDHVHGYLGDDCVSEYVNDAATPDELDVYAQNRALGKTWHGPYQQVDLLVGFGGNTDMIQTRVHPYQNVYESIALAKSMATNYKGLNKVMISLNHQVVLDVNGSTFRSVCL